MEKADFSSESSEKPAAASQNEPSVASRPKRLASLHSVNLIRHVAAEIKRGWKKRDRSRDAEIIETGSPSAKRMRLGEGSSSDTPNLDPALFPPDRGIEYKVGTKLDAQDEFGKWYSAKIVEIRETDGYVLVHFEYWSQRYDEWILANSHRLRPCTIKEKKNAETLCVGDFVFAKWGDKAGTYPAQIVEALDNDKFKLLYYDGFEKTVSKRFLKKMSDAEVKELDLVHFGQLKLLPDYPNSLLDPKISEKLDGKRRNSSKKPKVVVPSSVLTSSSPSTASEIKQEPIFLDEMSQNDEEKMPESKQTEPENVEIEPKSEEVERHSLKPLPKISRRVGLSSISSRGGPINDQNVAPKRTRGKPGRPKRLPGRPRKALSQLKKVPKNRAGLDVSRKYKRKPPLKRGAPKSRAHLGAEKQSSDDNDAETDDEKSLASMSKMILSKKKGPKGRKSRTLSDLAKQLNRPKRASFGKTPTPPPSDDETPKILESNISQAPPATQNVAPEDVGKLPNVDKQSLIPQNLNVPPPIPTLLSVKTENWPLETTNDSDKLLKVVAMEEPLKQGPLKSTASKVTKRAKKSERILPEKPTFKISEPYSLADASKMNVGSAVRESDSISSNISTITTPSSSFDVSSDKNQQQNLISGTSSSSNDKETIAKPIIMTEKSSENKRALRKAAIGVAFAAAKLALPEKRSRDTPLSSTGKSEPPLTLSKTDTAILSPKSTVQKPLPATGTSFSGTLQTSASRDTFSPPATAKPSLAALPKSRPEPHLSPPLSKNAAPQMLPRKSADLLSHRNKPSSLISPQSRDAPGQSRENTADVVNQPSKITTPTADRSITPSTSLPPAPVLKRQAEGQLKEPSESWSAPLKVKYEYESDWGSSSEEEEETPKSKRGRKPYHDPSFQLSRPFPLLGGHQMRKYAGGEFNPEWKIGREDWLEFDGTCMYCKPCRERYAHKFKGHHSRFVEGIAQGLLLSRVTSHENSHYHGMAVNNWNKRHGTGNVIKLPPDNRYFPNQLAQMRLKRLQEGKSGPLFKKQRKDYYCPGRADAQMSRDQWFRCENGIVYCYSCRNYSLQNDVEWCAGIPADCDFDVSDHENSLDHKLSLIKFHRAQTRVAKSHSRSLNALMNQRKTREIFVCPYPFCGLAYRSDDDLEKHVQLAHPSIVRDMVEKTTKDKKNKQLSSEFSKFPAEIKEQGNQGTIFEEENRPESPSSTAEDEMVRCICGDAEESGIMVQCEHCSMWQHGACFNLFDQKSVPRNYYCYMCKNPPDVRESIRYQFTSAQTWCATGELPQFICVLDKLDGASVKDKRYKAANVLKLNRMYQKLVQICERLRAARLKMKILKTQRNPFLEEVGPPFDQPKEKLQQEIAQLHTEIEKQLDIIDSGVNDYEINATDPEMMKLNKMPTGELLKNLHKIKKISDILS